MEETAKGIRPLKDVRDFGKELSALMKISQKAAEIVCAQKHAVVASHIDADGLTSAAIICSSLDRLNIEYTPLFFRQLDIAALNQIADLGPDLVIFTDMGSGMQSEICELGLNAIVADHHRPSNIEETDLLAHINPHLVGADGATHLSGSGAAFLLARAISSGDPRGNDDLSALATIGAVGDLQDMANGHLIGINRHILQIGARSEVLSFGPDLKLFGKQTRAVFKMLEYSQDPYIPGLSGDEDACIAFLKELGIRHGGERWRRWIDLNFEEKSRIVSALARKGLRAGIPSMHIERLVGEVYTLLLEREGTELRDASEYSTLLNATARYGHSDIGIKVCMGDRDKAFDQARQLLRNHRQNLVNGLKLVKENGITSLDHVQYFDAGDRIMDTIVGIVAGMSFSMADRTKPILAFAKSENGDIKVSARGTQNLVRNGLNLAFAISETVKIIGGIGGGHNIAAGATIPAGKIDEFLEIIDTTIGHQLSSCEN
jgi:single-stranded-DNA-specific exonuclease